MTVSLLMAGSKRPRESSKVSEGPSKKQISKDRQAVNIRRTGLAEYIQRPGDFPSSRVVYFDDEFVIINDAFPKSVVHLLLLPRDEVKTVQHPFEALADPSFARKVQAMVQKWRVLAAKELRRRLDCADQGQDQRGTSPSIERVWNDEIVAGVHAQPSMDNLHIHILSKDLHGAYLKNRKHYNSFSTSFFVNITAFPLDLEDPRRQAARIDYLHNDLICWRCQANFGTKFSQLARHLDDEFQAWTTALIHAAEQGRDQDCTK